MKYLNLLYLLLFCIPLFPMQHVEIDIQDELVALRRFKSFCEILLDKLGQNPVEKNAIVQHLKTIENPYPATTGSDVYMSLWKNITTTIEQCNEDIILRDLYNRLRRLCEDTMPRFSQDNGRVFDHRDSKHERELKPMHSADCVALSASFRFKEKVSMILRPRSKSANLTLNGINN